VFVFCFPLFAITFADEKIKLSTHLPFIFMKNKDALSQTSFRLPKQTAFYRGKVRDVYTLSDGKLVMVASDRISAFDHVLPRPIPFKGQVLNQIAAYFLAKTEDICPNWLMSTPDPNVAVGFACEPFKVEMVIRGYLAGHAARTYAQGGRVLCGVKLPEGLKENDRLPEPIITPTTKASEGHDEDISREDIIKNGIVSAQDYAELERLTRALFQRGTEMAATQGLILVDTKYEFGRTEEGKIVVIDEIHTPDSSRYFYTEGYAERQKTGEKQRQLSKEFVREWLMANGFQGLEGQTMPTMTDDFVALTSHRYIELFEKITGQTFVKSDTTDILKRIRKNIVANI
jgi:phosphoribosylaminoimidazole-succinocarboxamide synthase